MNFLENLYLNIFGDVSFPSLLISIAIAVAVYLVSKAIGSFLSKKSDAIATKLFKNANDSLKQAISKSLAKPVKMWVEMTGILVAVLIIPFSIVTGSVVDTFVFKLYRLGIIVVVGMLAVNLLDSIPHFSSKFAESGNQTILQFFIKISKALVWVFVAAIILKEIGYDVTGLVAGLGLGGVVLALAAQDTASNLFAGIVILFDKPFAIGDWVSVAGMEGIVEEMSFRSCRIRTFDNALISVPNSKLGSDSVINWTKMPFRKTRFTIGLLYSTKKETLQNVCNDIIAMLKTYEQINPDNILVVFDSFNASSLDIVIQYHTYLTGAADFFKLKEEVQYKVMDIVEANGTGFAYNTQTIIVEKGE